MTPIKELEGLLAEELGVDPKMIRFYAARMAIEISTGRMLTNSEQRHLFSRSNQKIMLKEVEP